MDLKVAVIDFDLEAPGLHYKFSTSEGAAPLPVKVGVVDYLHNIVNDGQVLGSIRNFIISVDVPGASRPYIDLMPAGAVLSKEYWLKLSGINWHDLFYSPGASGVQIFVDLKNRIEDELNPDFLLIDSRTGITEMGGVATTLLADKIVCLVLPSNENLEGARAVLRSLKRSQREGGSDQVEIIVALSRLPDLQNQDQEKIFTDRILTILNEPADDLRDTLGCPEIFVLHSEMGLQVHEVLRIGGRISPDDSILLRDYLRLFASLVPKELVEPKRGLLIQRAKEKIWEDPEGAMKEIEELAESFGHPENYRALLLFYEVRSVMGAPVLKRAQRLWELTRDPNDPILWRAVQKSFGLEPAWRRGRNDWSPQLDFVEAVWRHAGERDSPLALKLAQAYSAEDKDSHAADLLLETMKYFEPTSEVVARCINYLDYAKRYDDGDKLLLRWISKLGSELDFVLAWARHGERATNTRSAMELINHQSINLITEKFPWIAARLFYSAGMKKEANSLADDLLRSFGDLKGSDVLDIAETFGVLGRWKDFEEGAHGRVSPDVLEEARRRVGIRKRPR
jgi:hypothetical protein